MMTKEYLRRMGHEPNNGEASHDLSRFLCFGKEGALGGREFGDPISTFRCLPVLAFQLYRQGRPMEGERISRVKARGSPDAAITAVCSEPAIAKDDLRAWIRTDAEAALLWPFHSPAVPEGPYAKIDIGAGTTNASIFRVVADPETGYKTRERISFFGACSKPTGMDAID